MNEELPLPKGLMEAMAETQQNPRYHAEGSVLAHTRLVLEQYRLLSPQFELSPDDHEVLYWAAVLHDTGKVKATTWTDGRWRSTGHERMGVPIAMDILLQNPSIRPDQRRRILDLVRWHGFPLDFHRKGSSIEKLKLLGTQTDLRMLAIFSLFDFQGRICEDKDWVLQVMDQFISRDVPQVEYELGRFRDLQERFSGMNLRHKNALWTAYLGEQGAFLEKLVEARQIEVPPTYGKKVYLTIGTPLSGKTHWLAQQLPDVFRIDMAEHGMAEEDLSDAYYKSRKLVEFKHFLTVYTNRYKHVALDGRNLDIPFRHRLAEMIRGLGAELEYIVFEESLPEILRRNSRLELPQDESRIQELYDMQELVHPWEAHLVRYAERAPIQA